MKSSRGMVKCGRWGPRGGQGLQRQVADLAARHKAAKDSQAAAEGEVERLSSALKDAEVTPHPPPPLPPVSSANRLSNISARAGLAVIRRSLLVNGATSGPFTYFIRDVTNETGPGCAFPKLENVGLISHRTCHNSHFLCNGQSARLGAVPQDHPVAVPRILSDYGQIHYLARTSYSGLPGGGGCRGPPPPGRPSRRCSSDDRGSAACRRRGGRRTGPPGCARRTICAPPPATAPTWGARSPSSRWESSASSTTSPAPVRLRSRSR